MLHTQQTDYKIVYFCAVTCYDWLPLIEESQCYDAVYRWFVGAITNEKPRNTSIALDFLTPGKTYKAAICKDASDAHHIKNPVAFVKEVHDVTSTTTLDLTLYASGGAAIIIE